MRIFASTKETDRSTAHILARSRRSQKYDHGIGVPTSSVYSIQRKATCACGGGCPSCQTKNSDLKVSQPNDPAEIEADHIAEKVMRVPDQSSIETNPNVQSASPTDNLASPSAIHRKCNSCEEEGEMVQRKRLPSGGDIPAQSPAHVQGAIGSGGRPLNHQTRRFFEPRFGYDLSSVRIHTDSTASQSARAIGAKAYTLGSNIVFDSGAYRPETESGRHLLAHELVHVVQLGVSFSTINRRTIYRQPTAPERICVPGLPANDPACVESATCEKEAEESRKKPGTTIIVNGTDMPFPTGTGLRVPAHPDAVKGIHEWDDRYGAQNFAMNHNQFSIIGFYEVQQICQTDANGTMSVYVYYVTAPVSGDKYAVGPDSLKEFILKHGGSITAAGRNTDQLASPGKMLDPRKLPAAPSAFDEDPQMYYVAPKLPPYDKMSDAFIIGDYYHMRAYLRRMPDGGYSVLYYVAENLYSDRRPEWVVSPRWINWFTEHMAMEANLATFSYPFQKGAMPADYQAKSARFVMGAMKGDSERASSGMEAWTSAATDPTWLLQVAMGYAGAAVPVRPSAPNLRIIRSGGGGGMTPPVSETVVNPGVSSSPGPYVGRGRAAPVMAAETSVAPAPVQVPRLGPVGVPGWNPNPVPVVPPQPISSAATVVGVGAASGLGAKRAPRPDVDNDLDKEKKRG